MRPVSTQGFWLHLGRNIEVFFRLSRHICIPKQDYTKEKVLYVVEPSNHPTLFPVLTSG